MRRTGRAAGVRVSGGVHQGADARGVQRGEVPYGCGLDHVRNLLGAVTICRGPCYPGPEAAATTLSPASGGTGRVTYPGDVRWGSGGVDGADRASG
ncbi:hypothetical protein GCM10010193_20060 [Kitasatospora atroaurantiaca]